MAKLSFEQLIYMAIITALATGIITFFANVLFHYLKNKLDWFGSVKTFKRDYSFEQLKELYIPSYAIVAQSEFLRRFEHFDDKPYDEFPFIEVAKTKTKTVLGLVGGQIKRETINFSDVITEFNKEQLSNMIIDKGIFASQELLKLAVAYRYVHKFYTDETIESEKLENFQIQEVDLINRIVRLIVRETNEKLKQCSLHYSENEIELSTMLVDYAKTEMETDAPKTL
ncbi:hypothetical protein [Peribacillus sp. V2I11]|uniref:hypothetical protein n=1 Tax=Peribacillus sp. V2I11 TaxID=3042277 RepID=UPI00277E3DB1|nr:hypothetical protein [Peribacillus sp. V2I11]MDQ0882883.1 hypothetical protein [Peribacillus sp. V2I11]